MRFLLAVLAAAGLHAVATASTVPVEAMGRRKKPPGQKCRTYAGCRNDKDCQKDECPQWEADPGFFGTKTGTAVKYTFTPPPGLCVESEFGKGQICILP